MTRMIDEKTIISTLQGRATEEDLSNLQRWISESEDNARLFFKTEELHHQLCADVVPAEKVNAAMEKIMTQDEKSNGEEVQCDGAARVISFSRAMTSLLRYAAILMLGVVIGGAIIYKIGVSEEPKEVFVTQAVGGTQQMLLADGTKVWLRDGASLRYPETFNGEERRVSLNGEAYFEVAKDAEHPFIVQGDVVDVKVLGTKFNFQTISNKQNDEVALIEGSVNVSNRATDDAVLLSPGQKASIDKKTGKLVVSESNTILAAVWHDKLIPFDNANIKVIGDALEEIYGVQVVYSKNVDMKKTYSGVITHKDDIASEMRLLQHAVPVTFRVQGKTLTIMPQ